MRSPMQSVTTPILPGAVIPRRLKSPISFHKLVPCKEQKAKGSYSGKLESSFTESKNYCLIQPRGNNLFCLFFDAWGAIFSRANCDTLSLNCNIVKELSEAGKSKMIHYGKKLVNILLGYISTIYLYHRTRASNCTLS